MSEWAFLGHLLEPGCAHLLLWEERSWRRHQGTVVLAHLWQMGASQKGLGLDLRGLSQARGLWPHNGNSGLGVERGCL